jgi:hypothetical protein
LTTPTISGRWTPDDRAASIYQEVPFEVAPGSGAIEVVLEYDRSTGGVLDLGCQGPDGFRGWSGGARSRYVITPAAATPGYLPGPLTAGTWRVLFGLYRIPDAGLEYRLTITISSGARDDDLDALGHRGAPVDALLDPARHGESLRPQGSGAARRFPAPAGFQWLAGDLHCHTVHSDGVLGIEGVARLAASRGLDFLVVSDHNTVSHHPFLAEAGKAAGIVLVPGQEVTSVRGHANAFGDIGRVEFRDEPDAWLRTATERGGLLSINHPLGWDCAWRRPMSRRTPLAEVWHSSWFDRRDASPMAWWMAAGADEIVAVGGSDFHRPGDNAEPGSPTTWLLCEEPSPAGVMDALSAGRAAVAADPLASALLRLGDELVAIDAEGLLLSGPGRPLVPVRGARVTFPADTGAYWLEANDGTIMALASRATSSSES